MVVDKVYIALLFLSFLFIKFEVLLLYCTIVVCFIYIFCLNFIPFFFFAVVNDYVRIEGSSDDTSKVPWWKSNWNDSKKYVKLIDMEFYFMYLNFWNDNFHIIQKLTEKIIKLLIMTIKRDENCARDWAQHTIRWISQIKDKHWNSIFSPFRMSYHVKCFE